MELKNNLIRTIVHVGNEDNKPPFAVRAGSIPNSLFADAPFYEHKSGSPAKDVLAVACRLYNIDPRVCYLVDQDGKIVNDDTPITKEHELTVKMTPGGIEAQKKELGDSPEMKAATERSRKNEKRAYDKIKKQIALAREELDIMEAMFDARHDAHAALCLFEDRKTKKLNSLLNLSI
jgi:hypothetical protein